MGDAVVAPRHVENRELRFQQGNLPSIAAAQPIVAHQDATLGGSDK
jgi:hypothetical protein